MQPCGDGVDVNFMEIVMTMPFKLLRRDAELLVEGLREFRDAARQDGAGEREAVSHRVAEADLDRDAGLLRQLHQFFRERQDEAVDVRAGDVFKMAAGDDAVGEGLLHSAKVVVHDFATCLLEFQEDMIV